MFVVQLYFPFPIEVPQVHFFTPCSSVFSTVGVSLVQRLCLPLLTAPWFSPNDAPRFISVAVNPAQQFNASTFHGRYSNSTRLTEIWDGPEHESRIRDDFVSSTRYLSLVEPFKNSRKIGLQKCSRGSYTSWLCVY